MVAALTCPIRVVGRSRGQRPVLRVVRTSPLGTEVVRPAHSRPATAEATTATRNAVAQTRPTPPAHPPTPPTPPPTRSSSSTNSSPLHRSMHEQLLRSVGRSEPHCVRGGNYLYDGAELWQRTGREVVTVPLSSWPVLSNRGSSRRSVPSASEPRPRSARGRRRFGRCVLPGIVGWPISGPVWRSPPASGLPAQQPAVRSSPASRSPRLPLTHGTTPPATRLTRSRRAVRRSRVRCPDDASLRGDPLVSTPHDVAQLDE